MSRITVDSKDFRYSYVPNAPYLVSQVISPIHTVTNTYEEKRDVLVNKYNAWKNKVDNPIISSYTYNVNNLGQRVSVETAGEAFGATPAPWAWNYDVLGQVIKANNNSYVYDSIGNRKTSGKDNSVLTNYTSNNLNQYTAVNANTPTYDNEGNLLSGLSKTTSLPNRDTLLFAYNNINRPISVSRNGEVLESYEYDHTGRRVKKGNTITIYDGYNAIAEYNLNSKSLVSTNAWGLDLSNSTQGAGGVGGLLSVTDNTTQVPLVSYPTYDGNGNISEYLTEVEGGLISAHYEYDAFGNVIKKTGNSEYTYQFSTKPFDKLTGLNYYNYRLYDPVSGRWINRDPIYERGGLNPYSFIQNNGIIKFDYLGLAYLPFSGPMTTPDMYAPSEKEIPKPNFWGDQCNPCQEGDTIRDYTEWMKKRYANTLKKALSAITDSVNKRVSELCFNKGNAPDLKGISYGITHKVLAAEDNEDDEYSFYERFIQIGSFSLFPRKVTITWKKEDCSFKWEGEVYAEEKTGATPTSDPGSNFLDFMAGCVPVLFEPRKMEMGNFPINGEGKCSSK